MRPVSSFYGPVFSWRGRVAILILGSGGDRSVTGESSVVQALPTT